jgi:C8 domain
MLDYLSNFFYDQQTTNPMCDPSVEAKATEVCNKLIKNPKLKSCVTNFNAEAIMRTCITDYCSCKVTDKRQQCACNGISVLAKDCQYQGVKLINGWRDLDICRKYKFEKILLTLEF